MTSENAFDSAIIGGGISGLCAAYYLQKIQKKIALIEAANPGGVIRSESISGFTIECGPNVLLLKAELKELLQELGLADSLAYPQIKNYKQMVYINNSAIAVPKSLFAFLATPLIKRKDKYKIARNIFKTGIFPQLTDDLSVSDFFAGILGREAVEKVVDPVLQGIYGGDVSKLSARSVFPQIYEKIINGGSFFSAIRERSRAIQKPQTVTLKTGIQILIQRLLESLTSNVETINREVRDITKEGDLYRVLLSSGDSIVTKNLIIATAAGKTAAYLKTFIPDLAEHLYKIRSASLCVVHAAAKELPAHYLDSFGVLLPSSLNTPLLGVMFNSVIFPHVAAGDRHLLTLCYGGIRQPDFLECDDTYIVSFAEEDLRNKFGISNSEVIKITRWRDVIPQYELGHFLTQQMMGEAEKLSRGLFFIGSDRGGVGVADRIKTVRQMISAFC